MARSSHPSPAVRCIARFAVRVAAGLLPAGMALAGEAAASPGPADVQAAYDAARQANADRHAFDLVIETARCQPLKAGGHACQVDFTRRSEPDRRLYFDVVTVDAREGHWVLLAGLCVKKNAPTLR